MIFKRQILVFLKFMLAHILKDLYKLKTVKDLAVARYPNLLFVEWNDQQLNSIAHKEKAPIHM
jgi:hypothetical protein